MNTKVFKVDEAKVKELQEKDYKRTAMLDVIQSLMESHKNDSDDSFVTSPVFIGFQKMYQDAKVDFDNMKNKVYSETVDRDTDMNGLSWTLDYGTCELTVTMK